MNVKLLKPKDLVDVLEVSRATVTNLLRSGEIPSIVVCKGNQRKIFRVHPDAFQAWLRKRETKSATRQ